MAKSKLTYRNLIKYKDGTVVEFNSLPEEEKHRIGLILNETAMRAAGYVPVTEIKASKCG